MTEKIVGIEDIARSVPVLFERAEHEAIKVGRSLTEIKTPASSPFKADYQQILKRFSLQPDDSELRSFEDVVRMRIVGISTSSHQGRTGEINVPLTREKLKTLQNDSRLLTFNQREAIINWVLGEIGKKAVNGLYIYDLFQHGSA